MADPDALRDALQLLSGKLESVFRHLDEEKSGCAK